MRYVFPTRSVWLSYGMLIFFWIYAKVSFTSFCFESAKSDMYVIVFEAGESHNIATNRTSNSATRMLS